MSETQKKIQQLQIMEQSMQQMLAQKQTLQSQVLEVDSALEELEGTDKAYKIVGNIMVSADKKVLQKELTEKKETLTLRMQSFEKQETKFKDKTSALQKEVMDELKAKDGSKSK